MRGDGRPSEQKAWRRESCSCGAGAITYASAAAYGRLTFVPASKRPVSSGANERYSPSASAVSDLPQRAVTQERGIALALGRNGHNLLREELSFDFGFLGKVEDLADVFERR